MQTLRSRNFKPFEQEARRLHVQSRRNYLTSLLYLFQEGKCYFCGDAMSILLGKRNTVEKAHHTPKHLGGGEEMSNLVGSCHRCVEKRGSRTARQYQDSLRHRRNREARKPIF